MWTTSQCRVNSVAFQGIQIFFCFPGHHARTTSVPLDWSNVPVSPVMAFRLPQVHSLVWFHRCATGKTKQQGETCSKVKAVAPEANLCVMLAHLEASACKCCILYFLSLLHFSTFSYCLPSVTDDSQISKTARVLQIGEPEDYSNLNLIIGDNTNQNNKCVIYQDLYCLITTYPSFSTLQ